MCDRAFSALFHFIKSDYVGSVNDCVKGLRCLTGDDITPEDRQWIGR